MDGKGKIGGASVTRFSVRSVGGVTASVGGATASMSKALKCEVG